MSQFKPYPAYKDSGVEWLGEVPEHWRSLRLKQAVNPARQITYGIVQAGDNVPDGIPYIRPADMTDESGVKDKETLLRTSIDIAASYRRSSLKTGDIVCSIGPSFGKLMITPSSLEGANLTQGTARVAVSEGNITRYFFWVLRSSESFQQWESSVGGATFRALNLGPLSETFVPCPPSAEQTQIARFLDHETARIDALIEEQQRLIELLKEKRQAVISHAVTKGLDPTVPMKDSGVEWLGEVPAHWDVCAVRRVVRAIEQGWSPECEAYPADEDGWGVLKAGCVNRGVFDPSENKTLPPSLEPIAEYEVHAGDILMSRASGSPELVGSTALLGEVRERLMLSDKIFRIHLEEKISSQFFVWVMNSQFMRAQIEQALSGGNGLANNLPQSSLLAFWLAVPSDHEQDAIAEFINEQTGKIDALISEGGAAIELLHERRSALISAAVTGKIDVRGWQAPASSASSQQKAGSEAVA